MEAVQIGYDAKTRAVGIRSAPEGGLGVLMLRAQPNGRLRLVDTKKLSAHHGLAVNKARRLGVEEFGGGLVGSRLTEKEVEAPAKTAKAGGRRKAVADS